MKANPSDSFMPARILFYCTYGTDLNFDVLFSNHDLGIILEQNIAHLTRIAIDEAGDSEVKVAATRDCCEHLKLLYNILANYPHQRWRFRSTLSPILEFLNSVAIVSPPLEPPVSLLINALVHFDFENQEDHLRTLLFPGSQGTIYLDLLTRILDLAVDCYTTSELDLRASPLVQVLLRISSIAPPGPKSYLCALLMPSEKDRESVLGKGSSLSSKLLSLFNEISAPHLKELLPALYFELSDNHVDLFVKNVGYGLAAGFLRSNCLQPEFGVESPSMNNAGNARHGISEVNPITGQRLDREQSHAGSDFTEEEKEREAERLFVLFERLRATGVINVENPVAQAQHRDNLEGRFEEVE
ncbi:hypothetical protein D6D05_10082 [Aureobasidium pullulans]|nr:hypothetical protein D6D05_10082 [Aureobasidium pullulans]